MRNEEYYSNTERHLNIIKYYFKFRKHKLGIKLDFDIPINVLGPGARIDHWGMCAISSNCVIGKNCHIYGDINIGIKGLNNSKAPRIGNNVTIGAGARILGDIRIEDEVEIGANSVVTKSCLIKGATLAGIPAKIIK